MKPSLCPCGGEPTITIRDNYSSVHCEECFTQAFDSNERRAVKKWNSMVAQQEYMAAIEAVRVPKNIIRRE